MAAQRHPNKKAQRHPNKVVEDALAYARHHGWAVVKTAGGSAHAWGVMRCRGDCPQVSVFSTPRVPENHARALGASCGPPPAHHRGGRRCLNSISSSPSEAS